MWNLMVLLAQDQGGNQQPTGGGGIAPFVPLLFLGLLFYLFFFRPMRRQEKERLALLSSLKTGDEVITNSGIVGKVVEVSDKDDRMVIQTAGNTRLRMLKSVVARNLSNEEAAKAAKGENVTAKT
jgi:preprotein translocase subunit YajC